MPIIETGRGACRAASAALCLLIAAAADGRAQERTGPPLWSVALEGGRQFPAWVYDERVSGEFGTEFVDTRYEEQLDAVPVGRVAVRFRPAELIGAQFGVQYTRGSTTAEYSGGLEPQERFRREMRIWTVGLSATVRLFEWSGGEGGFAYAFGPVLSSHRLDLSSGHRDSFADFSSGGAGQEYDWTERSWISWGLAVGAETRFPIGRRMAVRFGVEDQILPVNTSEIEQQERDEVRRLTGRTPVFNYNAYTAHYVNLRVGFEYVLHRELAPDPPPRIALPRPGGPAATTSAVLAAQRSAAAGDTAAAVDALRARTDERPEDASAWKSLALLLAARAETSVASRDEAWATLQRALNMNPGDEALLAAYGRVRALLRRAGHAAGVERTLAVSELSARADAAGVLSLAWAVENVGAAGEAAPRYSVRVEVVDADGEPVPLRPLDPADAPPVEVFETERMLAGEPPFSERLDLRMARARPGPYAVRISLTDPATGQTVQRSGGFEIR